MNGNRSSRQIDSLQSRGLLEKEVTDADRRATFAVLTVFGKSALEEAEQVFLEAYYSEFRNLIPEKDLVAFDRVLGLLMQDPEYSQRILDIVDTALIANRNSGRVLHGRKPSAIEPDKVRRKAVRSQ